jgi:signal transduction histidine kinase
LPLKAQISLLAILIAISSAMIASFGPGLVIDLRDVLFEASLAAADREALESAKSTYGQCGPAYQALRDRLGFDSWRLNYDLVLYGAVAVVTIAMAALAWLLSARLSAPIEDLARSVRSVATGTRVGGPAIAPRSAEVATLVADFAAMTSALRAADDDLRLRSAAIAHDIRTPLTILQGRLTGIREGMFRPDSLFIDGLIEQIGWIDHLVSDVNALSDAQQAGVGTRQRVDLAELIQECVDSLRLELAAAGVALQREMPPDVLISADRARMRRVVLNILRNLIRHAPDADARIVVTRVDGWAVVEVADSGPGWPVGDPDVLTQAFVRGDISRSRATGGSGLGLSIVEVTVKSYGGTVKLTRGAGGGAVITFTLPLAS